MKGDLLERLTRQLRPEAWPAVIGTAIGLSLLAGWLYGIRPGWLRYRELSSSPVALADVLARAAGNESAVAALEDELRALRDRLYGTSTALPLEQLESHVIDRLDRLCAERDIQLVSVTPGNPDRILSFDEFPYDVDVRGRYFSLYDWLRSVEHELRPLIVKQFALSGGRPDGSVQMNLRLVSYRPSPEGV